MMTTDNNDESISSSNSDSSNECPFNPEIASKVTAAFAKATGIDQEFAIQLLKDHDWNIDQALKATYEAKEHAELILTKKQNWKEIKDQYLRVFSWNTDTTDSEEVEINDLIEQRTQSIIEILLREKPDVIFLQQIGTFSLTLIITCLSEFYDDESTQIDSPNNCNYVSIFTLKSTTKKTRVSIIENSENWKMIKLEIKYKNLISIDLFNAFIDDKTSSFCFEQIHRTNPDHLLISAISSQISDDSWQSLPIGLDDLWCKTGEQIETVYTFDPELNDNISEKVNPQRSDRIFFQATTTKSSFQPVHMELEGIQRTKNSNHSYPSSHWAIQGYFQIAD